MKKLIITSKVLGKSEEFENQTVIPRVGERVAIWYNPAPTVTEVLHMISENTVIVVVE